MTIGSVQVAPSSSDQLSLMSASSQTVGSGLNLQASQTTNTRECPPTLATSLFGYVATRKSLACRNPPNRPAGGIRAAWARGQDARRRPVGGDAVRAEGNGLRVVGQAPCIEELAAGAGHVHRIASGRQAVRRRQEALVRERPAPVGREVPAREVLLGIEQTAEVVRPAQDDAHALATGRDRLLVLGKAEDVVVETAAARSSAPLQSSRAFLSLRETLGDLRRSRLRIGGPEPRGDHL